MYTIGAQKNQWDPRGNSDKETIVSVIAGKYSDLESAYMHSQQSQRVPAKSFK